MKRRFKGNALPPKATQRPVSGTARFLETALAVDPLKGYVTESLKLFFAVRSDVVNSLLNRRDFLSFFVWNFGFEFVFKCHHELDHVE